MRYFERVTVALCRSAVDADVLRYARTLGSLGEGKTRFTFLHVLPPANAWERDGGVPATLADVRNALRDTVHEHFGAVPPSAVQVRTGSHVDELLSTAAEAGSDLLMVGHRRSARGRRSSSRRLAMKAPCSLLMVPEGAPPELSHIVAAVDFSQPSAYALSLASLLASRAGHATLTAVHVVDPDRLGFEPYEEEDTSLQFERFLAPLDLHDVDVRRVIEESGSVSGVTLRQAVEMHASLVVVGTRGRSQAAAILLGSESEQLIVESTMPVLVTKDRGTRMSILRAILDRDFRSPEPQFG